jgi:hypothetical protein
VADWRDVSDAEGNDVTAAQLAVDGEVEPSEVALSICHLQFVPCRLDVAWSPRRLGADQLASVQRRPADGLRFVGYAVLFHGLSPFLRDGAACARNELSAGSDGRLRAISSVDQLPSVDFDPKGHSHRAAAYWRSTNEFDALQKGGGCMMPQS